MTLGPDMYDSRDMLKVAGLVSKKIDAMQCIDGYNRMGGTLNILISNFPAELKEEFLSFLMEDNRFPKWLHAQRDRLKKEINSLMRGNNEANS
jgi:hypothetical protein